MLLIHEYGWRCPGKQSIFNTRVVNFDVLKEVGESSGFLNGSYVHSCAIICLFSTDSCVAAFHREVPESLTGALLELHQDRSCL